MHQQRRATWHGLRGANPRATDETLPEASSRQATLTAAARAESQVNKEVSGTSKRLFTNVEQNVNIIMWVREGISGRRPHETWRVVPCDHAV